jgi:hypothetical protein
MSVDKAARLGFKDGVGGVWKSGRNLVEPDGATLGMMIPQAVDRLWEIYDLIFGALTSSSYPVDGACRDIAL